MFHANQQILNKITIYFVDDHMQSEDSGSLHDEESDDNILEDLDVKQGE